jgi:hypothetical protein
MTSFVSLAVAGKPARLFGSHPDSPCDDDRRRRLRHRATNDRARLGPHEQLGGAVPDLGRASSSRTRVHRMTQPRLSGVCIECLTEGAEAGTRRSLPVLRSAAHGHGRLADFVDALIGPELSLPLCIEGSRNIRVMKRSASTAPKASTKARRPRVRISISVLIGSSPAPRRSDR